MTQRTIEIANKLQTKNACEARRKGRETRKHGPMTPSRSARLANLGRIRLSRNEPEHLQKKTKDTSKVGKFYNEMKPEDRKELYEVREIKYQPNVAGKLIRDWLDKLPEVPSAYYSDSGHQRHVFHHQRWSKMQQFANEEHAQNGCQTPNVWLDMTKRRGKKGRNAGFDMVPRCTHCDWICKTAPVHLLQTFGNDEESFNSFHCLVREASNSASIGEAELTTIFRTFLDVPIGERDVHYLIDGKLNRLVEHQLQRQLSLARTMEKKSKTRVNYNGKINEMLVNLAIDGAWMKRRESRHGYFLAVSQDTNLLLEVKTASKGLNFRGASVNMEPYLCFETLSSLIHCGLIPNVVARDDNEAVQHVLEEIARVFDLKHQIKSKADFAHFKKNFKKKNSLLKNLKTLLNQDRSPTTDESVAGDHPCCDHPEWKSCTSAWAEKLFDKCYHEVIKDFEFQDEKDSSEGDDLVDLWKTIDDQVVKHYAPATPTHEHCRRKHHDWCHTAFGNAGNRDHLRPKSRTYPVGIGKEVLHVLKTQVYTTKMLKQLARTGTTSLAEATNHVVSNTTTKDKPLADEKYRGQMGRGCLQWQKPYDQYKDRLILMGYDISPAQNAFIETKFARYEYNATRFKRVGNLTKKRKQRERWNQETPEITNEECKSAGDANSESSIISPTAIRRRKRSRGFTILQDTMIQRKRSRGFKKNETTRNVKGKTTRTVEQKLKAMVIELTQVDDEQKQELSMHMDLENVVTEPVSAESKCDFDYTVQVFGKKRNVKNEMIWLLQHFRKSHRPKQDAGEIARYMQQAGFEMNTEELRKIVELSRCQKHFPFHLRNAIICYQEYF